MPPKRAADTAATREAKRYKSAIDEMAEEFCCPITQELPLDPVTAEDGRIYEKEAIESWMRQRPGQELKSPVTNEPMGRKLFPAVQAKNTIRSMVKSGAISGDKAEAWKKRIEEEEQVTETRRLAEQGNAAAMYNMGVYHRDGCKGVAQDEKQAFEWFQKAADLDDPTATTSMAKALLGGRGVTKDAPTGLLLLGRASGLGSEHACYVMGHYHVRGFGGLSKDVQATRKWYLKMATASTCDSPQSARDEVATWLRENN